MSEEPPVVDNSLLPTTIPLLSASQSTPQYHYQATVEDHQLVAELVSWLLHSKLAFTTPAHLFAASPAIRKELVERLRTKRVEASFYDKISSPVSVLGFTPRLPEYSLPL